MKKRLARQDKKILQYHNSELIHAIRVLSPTIGIPSYTHMYRVSLVLARDERKEEMWILVTALVRPLK